MKDKSSLIVAGTVLGIVALAYIGWKQRLRAFPEAIEDADFEEADALAGELLDAGFLGRDIRGPVAVLGAALAVMTVVTLLSSAARPVGGGSESTPSAFGYGSYL